MERILLLFHFCFHGAQNYFIKVSIVSMSLGILHNFPIYVIVFIGSLYRFNTLELLVKYKKKKKASKCHNVDGLNILKATR